MPRPTSFCVPLVKRIHIVTNTSVDRRRRNGVEREQEGVEREREKEPGSVTGSRRVSERARWKVERNEHEARCSSVDDSSLPWGARATHTRPRLDACVYAWCTRVRRELVTAMHSLRLSPRADLYTSRSIQPPIWHLRIYVHTRCSTHTPASPSGVALSLAVIAHTSTTQLLAARCGIIYPII